MRPRGDRVSWEATVQYLLKRRLEVEAMPGGELLACYYCRGACVGDPVCMCGGSGLSTREETLRSIDCDLEVLEK